MAKDDVIIYTGYMKKQPEKLSPYIQSIDPVKTTCETHVTLKRTFENSNVRPKRSDVRPKRSDVRLKRSNVRFNFVTFRLPYGRAKSCST